MKLPITSWKNTLKSLGYQVVRNPRSFRGFKRGSQRIREKINQPHSYQLLEPRQLLAADTLIHVVDRVDDLSYQYSLNGNSTDSFSLQDSRNARGTATSPDGSTLYVIDARKDVYVFNTETGGHLGTWRAHGLSSVQGIATDGTHLWIVDKARDRVYFFANAADNRWGSQSANGQFDLERDNKKPSGITTDGSTIWVVDEKQDQVYVYDTSGNSLGDWELDSANDKPKGIAIDPSGGDGIWVVDEKDDRVYYYAQGRDHTSGYHWASSSFSLDSDNRKAEGIAISPSDIDPPGAPVIDSITDDTGISSTDGVTNDPTLLISGTAEPGNTITLTETSLGVLGTSTVDSSGNWIVDLTSISLADGQYSVTAIVSNGTETSDPSAPFVITIDTTPTPNLAVLRIDRDSGIDDSDGITNDNTIVVAGATEPKVLITLSESTLGQIGTAVADSAGEWSVDLTSIVLPDSIYIFRATATDIAGNTSLPSAPLAIVIDTSAPTSPAITGISDDTGSSSVDGVTSNPVQRISGTAEPNAVITLTDDVFGVIAIAMSDLSGDWSIEKTFAEAAYNVTATSTDKAGNESAPSQTFVFVVDQTAPVAPGIERFDTDSGSTGDGITNDDTLVFHGTAEAGTIVTLIESTLGVLGTAFTGASGNWDLDVTGISLVDGSYLFSASSEDLAGNVSGSSQLLSVIVDTIAPGIPSITRVDDDSGLSNSDSVTNDNTLTFTGMATAGATVSVSEMSIGAIGTAVADASGVWLLDATSKVLPDGTYLFSAIAEDVAGNVSPSSSPFNVEIDTLAPGQATIANIDSDTGSVPDDGITSDSTLVFDGTADPGAIVTLTETVLGLVGRVTTDEFGVWQIDLSDVSLVDGTYSFSVYSEDIAGNIGPTSPTSDIVVDTLGPSLPSIVRANEDTGQSDTDGVTNDNTLVFTGMAEPNSIVHVLETGLGLIGATIADNSGVWSLDATSTALADGVYLFTAIAEDVAGNMSPVSAPLNIEVDTVAPVQVVITSIDDDTGSISNDGITSDNTLLFNGTAEPGAVVTLSEAVLGPIGHTTADESGLWQIDATATPFADGHYNFSATSEDTAGNVSAPGVPFSVVVDTAGPAAPSIVRVDDDNGASNFDGVTNDNTLVFAGMAMPNSAVSVFEATLGLIGVTSASGSGAWTLDATSIIWADGVYDFTAIAEDTAGNTSPISNTLTVEIDTVAPAPAAITSVDTDTGSVPDDGITNDNTLFFNGTAEPDSVLTLSESVLGILGTTTANASGIWQIDATTTSLADGAYRFMVSSEDLAGNVSAPSISFDVVIDTMAPSVPSISRVNDDTGASDTDSVTNDNTLNFTGMAAPDSIVKVFEVSLGLIGTTTADSAGVWTLDATANTLSDGSYSFSAVAEDIAGNVSAASAELNVVVDTTNPIEPVVDRIDADTGADGSDGVTNDNTLILTGTAEAWTEVAISDPVFGLLGTTTTDASGNWQVDASATTLVDGTYHFTALSSDLAGNTSLSDALVVRIDTAAPDVPTIVAVNDDNGISSSDGITNDSTLSIIGLADANAMVRIFDMSLGLVGTTTADATGVWTINLPSVADGSYGFTATAEDLAGNISSASDAFDVVIDTVAPQTPTLDLDPLFDSAPIGDQITDLPVVTLIGTTEPGANVVLYLDLGPVGGPIGDTVADANGDFSFTDVSLAPGANSFYVFATDLAGNQSSNFQSITNTTEDDEDPVVVVGLLNDTGQNTNDRISTDPTLVGFIEDASPVTAEFWLYNELLDTEYFVDITSELVDGEFELDLAFLENLVGIPLPFGQYYYYVGAIDSFGNYGFLESEFRYVEFDDGDFDPPEVTIRLLNDTGESDTDNDTSDGSLTGTIIDESPVMVTLSIVDLDDIEAGNDHVGDVTDLLRPDGTYVIPQSRLESILGRSLTTRRYYIDVEARDALNVGGASLRFDYIQLADPPVITSVISDTGISSSDGITNDTTFSVVGTTYPYTEIELYEDSQGSLGSTTSDSNGDWSFAVSGPWLVDATYKFSAFVISSFEPSDASNVFIVTLDTESPLRARFDLEPAFDTGVVGDSYTTTELVTLSGTTLPNAEVRLLGTGLSTFADAEGSFSLLNVQLDLGRRIYEVVTLDEAGNESVARKSIAYDQPITLSESGFVTEATQLIELGQDIGVRTVSLRIDAMFGDSPLGLEDSFHVYLVDPGDTSSTLLDRGVAGTSLFSLIGDHADYLPGRVRFDGSVVEIDVSSVEGFSEGLLLFQLINNDDDASTTISISNLGSIVNERGLASPTAVATQAVAPGAPFDVSGFTASSGLTLLYENIRYDSASHSYVAEVRLRNDGPDLGRSIAVSFDSLAGDVTFLNASGTDGSNNPYVSMRNAIPSYGLLAGQVSEAVRVEFIAPTVSPFAVSPIISDGGPNSAPVLDPVGTINVTPGDVVRIDLSATDADGQGFYFTIRSDGELPNTTLTATGQLVIAPSPDQIGSYAFEILATDGVLSSSRPVTVNVVADPVTTTRISGLILDTNSVPLAGIPVELGGTSVLTAADGSFEIEFIGALPDDTLKVHGEAYTGPEVYPFIAEKLPLLYGHDAYENVNNFIERPIYLPALDVANGVTIDPAVDITVTTSAIPNASVFVAAGTLATQDGGPFTGKLSITEVPADFTPAALPADLFPDMVVTIQPGEMVFTTPAPLNLPNLAGYLPGTEMTLWSINPNTGLFDDVGVGVVSADGATVETVSGGINNSSWHFFANAGPVIKDPKSNPRNQNKECNDCELTDFPNDDNAPQIKNEADDGDIPLNTDSVRRLAEALLDPNIHNPSPAAGSGGRGRSGRRSGGLDGGWGTGGSMMMGRSADFGPYGSWGGGIGATVSFGGLGSRSNVTPSNHPLLAGNDRNANDTEVALHSGAVYKSHDLTPYQSLNAWHGLQLNYDSERADARPIISTGFNNIQNNLPDPTLATKLSLSRGNLRMDVPGFFGIQSGLTGGEHFFRLPPGASSLDVAIQADMRNLPTGVYEYESTNRFAGNASGSFTGTASVANDRLVHVNSVASPFGAGWGLSGLLEIVENPDGSVLLVDGDGGELLFEAPANIGAAFISPAGDFSTLIKLGDGRFQRTHVDQTVELFSLTNRLTSITDRNGNVTQFQYDGNDNIEFIVDPVGLTTIFRYAGGKVTEIENPAGSITTLTYVSGNLVGIQDPDTTVREFSYDSLNRLTGEVDKLGETESLKYGFSGRIESIMRKDGSTVSYSPVQTQGLSRPDQTNNLASQIPAVDLGSIATAKQVDANGNVTQVELDKQGQLLSAGDAEGDLPEVARNNENLVERVVDGRGNLTIINYDERGNVISISDVISRGAATDPLFSDPIYPVVQYTNEIVTADINGDGFVDVISESGTLGDSVSVQLGNGAGGFSIGTNYSVLDPVSLQVADVNNDGNFDVVTTNVSDQISVLLGNGDGTLQDALTFATGVSPQKILSADLNRDGFVDLVTTDNGGDTVSVLLGDGTGQFNSFNSFAVADSPRSMAIGDINNDNILDIVVGNNGSENGLSILVGYGDGGFAPSTFVPTNAETEFVVLTDFTGDGDLDAVTGDSNLVMLPGQGDGTFGMAEVTTTGSSPGSLKSVRAIAIDVDSDGDQDLVFADSSIAAMLVFENDGSGAFTPGQSIAASGNSMLAADVNFDGIEDIVTLDGGIVSVIGKGDGTFVEPPPPSDNNIPVGDGPSSLAVADFNNDGHQDIVVGAQLDSTINVMLGAGDGTLSPLTPIASAGLVISVAASDLDGDGNVDLVTAHYDSDSVEVRYGDGLGGFAAPTSITFPSQGPLEIKFGDFNNDSNLDIVTVGYRGSADPGFAIAFSNGDRTFSAGPLIGATFQAGTIDVGDINADGNLDVVVGVSYFSNGNAARPYFGNGDGTFVDQGRIPFGGGSFAGPPEQLNLVDLDGDGDLDIVGIDEAQNGVKVLNGTGNGTFEPVVSYSMDSAPRTLDVGDINNDGILDVIATNLDSDRVSIFFGQNDGTLTSRHDFAVGDGPYGVKLVDLDEDGSLDFVTANAVADAISIRINSTDLANQAAQVFEYDSVFSQITRSIDEAGRVVIYDIDPSNGNTLSMTQVIGALGGGDDIVTSYTYTSNGLLDTVTDPLGRVTDLDYNAGGLLERVSYAVGTPDEAFVSYEYDAAGNQTAIIDELGHRTEYVYDPMNRVTQMIEPDPDGAGLLSSPVSTNVYDDHGNLVSATDALNNTTQFVYDEQHRLIETIDANLESINHQYDQSGNLVATVDRLGRRTEFVYDQRNRLTETVDAEGGRASKAYDEDNNVVAMVDENGVSTQYVYDARSRLVRTINAWGGLVRYEYDRVDNLIAMTDELGRRTEMTFDELDRMTTTTLPDPDKSGPELAPVTMFVYDDASNVILTMDALGNTTAMGYDERDRLVEMTESDPDGAGPLASPVWSSEFDDASRLIRSTDPLGRETSFVYDDLNRIVSVTLPDPDRTGPDSSPQTTYTYDSVHNLRTITDALGNTTVIGYDDLYRVVSTTEADPDGAGPLLSPITTLVFNAEGQAESVTDPLGRTTVFAYDLLGRMVTETLPDPDGAGPDSSPAFTREYDGVGNELLMTDALGNVTQYVYDDLYRLVGMIETDPDGVVGPESNPTTVMTYDAAHQLVSISDPLNRTTTYEYDDLGRVIRETYPDPDRAGPDVSPEMTFVYDLMNNQLSMTDALGNTTAYAYDNLYRLISKTEADPDGAGPELNPVTTYVYDVASQLTSMTDALGRSTSMEYDDLGRVVGVTEPDPDGAGPSDAPVMTYDYDLMNNELSMTDALGNVTEYEYDNLYRMTKIIQADPDGSGPQTHPTSTFGYDVASQVTSTTDPLGRVTLFVYDDLGRVVEERFPDPDGVGPLLAPVMTHVFDLMNNQLSMTDAVGNVTTYGYDNLYRLTRLIEADPDGDGPLANPVTEYSYDIASQLLSTTDPLNRTSTNEYDDLGRVIRMTQPDPDGAGPLAAPEMSYVYDLMHNQLSMTDPLGHVTQYEYDDLYRVVREIGEDLDGAGPLTNPTVDYSYDLLDNLLSLTDSSGNQTQYSYDDLDRLFEETIELGTGNFETRQFEYDLEDNLIRRTDRNARVIEFEYDAIYRMVEERWLDATNVLVNTIQFEFDEASQMLRAEDLMIGSRYDYTYDDLSRVTQSVVNNGGPAVVFSNALDAQSRRIARTTSVSGVDDFRNVYSYDGLNRLTRLDQVGQPGGNAVADKRIEIGYNADDQLTSISRYKDLAGGASNLVMQSAYDYDGMGRLKELIHSSSAATIVDYDWTYDAASRITQSANSVDGASDFNYDNTNQLTGATHASQTDESYEVDEDGNRTNTGYSTGFYNRLISDGTFDYDYDAEGNRTKRTNIATGSVTEYDWDHRNRLVSVTERASDGGAARQTVAHRYDVFNRWISNTVDSDGDGPVVSETTRYEYDGNQIVLAIDHNGSVTNRYLWGPGIDQLLADEQVGDQVYWTAADHLGTVRDIVDSNGAVANHIVYDSFGNVFSETNATVTALFGYTGRPLDESTGLQNNLNRWYDSATGRWANEDPVSFQAGDANLYRYVGNNSLNAIDPSGLDWLDNYSNWVMNTFNSRRFYRDAGRGGHIIATQALGVSNQRLANITATEAVVGTTAGVLTTGAILVVGGEVFAGAGLSTSFGGTAAVDSAGFLTGAEFAATQSTRVAFSSYVKAFMAGEVGGTFSAEGFLVWSRSPAGVAAIEAAAIGTADVVFGIDSPTGPDDVARGVATSLDEAIEFGSDTYLCVKGRWVKQVPGAIQPSVAKRARRLAGSFDDFALGRGFASTREAEKAWEVYQRAARSKEIVIGFGNDVVKHGAKNGSDILAFSEKPLSLAVGDWWRINKAWLDGAIDAGVDVRLVSRGDDVAEALEVALQTGAERGFDQRNPISHSTRISLLPWKLTQECKSKTNE